MTTCPECAFTYGALPRELLAPTMAGLGRETAARLAAVGDLTTRREPDQWSPLEYACHIRDVLLVQRDRLFVALVEDEPSFKPMYRDHRVGFDRYRAQDPDAVSAQLVMAAAMAAHAFGGLDDDQWARPLIYNFPSPQSHDVEWMAHHTLHEMTHHRGDIDRIAGGT
jgi:S-DNA-T family DNA segregation ATPase FtsK/SpoIIIE